MLARLVAYVGVLALLAIFGLHLWDQLPFGAAEPAAKADWSVAARSYPAFAVSQSDISGKNRDLRDLPASRRRPQGYFPLGRTGEKPVAELEIIAPAAN